MTAATVANSFVMLRCKAARGVLAHELGILVEGREALHESVADIEMITSDRPVADEWQDAWIGANVVAVRDDAMLVELPRQVINGGRRIWVSRNQTRPNGHTISTGHPAAN